MWRDSREARRKRYERYLSCCQTLAEPAAELQIREMLANMEEISQDTEAAPESDSVRSAAGSSRIDRNVCDYVLSPALNGFVLWVLREALASGKKRLYFLARDGYLMYRAAALLCEELKLDIECRYLCCSRYSLRIPAYHLDYTDALEYICRGGIDVTVGKILDRAALSEEEKENVLSEMNAYFEKHGHRSCGMEEELVHAELPEIRKALEASADFRKLLEAHSRAAMPALEGYLIQEGLLDSVPAALVDSGWVGSMQKVLNQILDYIAEKKKCRQRSPLEGYYWGLYELPVDVDVRQYHCYYFDPGSRLQKKVHFSNCLFECIFSAPHGMTLRYEENEGQFQPVFAEVSAENESFIRETEERLMQYTASLAGDLKARKTDLLACVNDKKAIGRLLSAFMGAPTREEAGRYGSLSFTDDVLEKKGKKLAEPMTEKELSDNHLLRKAIAMFSARYGGVKESAWYEGSAVNSGRHVGRHLRRYAGYKYLLYLRKRHMWRKNPGRKLPNLPG